MPYSKEIQDAIGNQTVPDDGTGRHLTWQDQALTPNRRDSR